MDNSNKNNVILGIESSCDDTSASIVINGEIRSNVVADQKVHQEYGGVVPELASRAHQKNILPVVESAIKSAGITKDQISCVAFTRGPGLLGSLLVGVSFAKGFAMANDLPMVEVNHMQAHILAHFIEDGESKHPEFPFICLTVSGGHTQIVLVKDHHNMEILGTTIDDAAGEAFDKIAKIMGLPYPGGPLIDKNATGDPLKFTFPISNVPDFNYSFSGLKTAVMYFLNRETNKNPNFVAENLNDICASVQHTIIKTLLQKLKLACKEHDIKGLAIAGGVSANSGLRAAIQELATSKNMPAFIPKFQYCTDNAGMIATAGYYRFLDGKFCDQSVTPNPRLSFS